MRRQEKSWISLLAIGLLSTIPALAEELNGEILPSATQPMGESTLAPGAGTDEYNDEMDPEERRRIYAAIPEAQKGPTRFSLEDRKKFRSWIHGLCLQEAVANSDSTRLRFRGAEAKMMSAKNKQGSLRLLLENYVDDLQNKTLMAPERKWVGYAHWRLAKSAKPATAEQAWKSVKEARLKTLKVEFWELREAASLDGKPDTLPRAREILKALREDSNCSTRAVEITSKTRQQFLHAQK